MIRKITYWGSTGIIAVISTLAGFTYLVGSPEIVQRFQPVGYPEQLRILLGIAKALGVIVLLILGHDREPIVPLILLALAFVSYYSRPSKRRWLSNNSELSNSQTTLASATTR